MTMANFAYTLGAADLLRALVNFTTGDFRIILVMTLTTADTERSVQFVGSLTTLDEYDGANYVRKTLAGEAVNTDTANFRGEFDANDISWTALGAGTRQAAGMILYRFVTNDADSPILAWIDTTSPSVFPFSGNGGDVNVAWNAEGIYQTQA